MNSLQNGMICMLIACSTLHAQDSTTKIPPPDDAARQEALQLIGELFRARYASANTPDDYSALAKEMLAVANASEDDPAGRFVTLRIARDVAAKAGDFATTFSAIEVMDKHYHIDALAMKVNALDGLEQGVRGRARQEDFASELTRVLDEAVAKDRFDLAKKAGRIAFDAARQSRSNELIKSIVDRNDQIKQIEAEFNKASTALATLTKSPNDPAANSIVGQYLCFVKGEWADGLVMLAVGDEPKLKSIAEMELSDNQNPLVLGDAWWTLAESQQGLIKEAIQSHAVSWYRKALPDLSGLSKAKVELRVGSPEKADEHPPSGQPKPANGPQKVNVSFQFTSEETVKDSWLLGDGGWRIENNGIRLHGRHDSWMSLKHRLKGDFTFQMKVRLDEYGAANVHACGENIELKGATHAQNILLAITRKDNVLHVQRNGVRSQIQIKEKVASEPTEIRFVFRQWDSRPSSAFIGAVSLMGDIIVNDEADASTADDWATALAGTRWMNSNQVTFEWTNDGRLIHGRMGECEWKVVGSRKVEVKYNADHVDTLEFNEAVNSFKQVVNGGTVSFAGRKL